MGDTVSLDSALSFTAGTAGGVVLAWVGYGPNPNLCDDRWRCSDQLETLSDLSRVRMGSGFRIINKSIR